VTAALWGTREAVEGERGGVGMRTQVLKSGTNVLKAPLSHASSFYNNFSDLFRQAPFSLLFCSFTGLLAGLGLGLMTDMLELLPGLMILIPPAIDMRGNIYSALVSRLGTSMHLGLFSPSLKRGSVLHQNAYSSLLLTLILSVLLSFLAKIVADAFRTPSISLHELLFISVFGGLISGLVLLAIALLVSIIGYRRSWDLDNMSSPIITSAGDVITIPSLFFAAFLVLKLEVFSHRWSWGSWLSPLFLLSILFIAAALVSAIKGLRSNDARVKRIIRESIPMLFIAGLLSTLAGVSLNIRLERLIALPALLVLIPPFLGESNALGGILSSRLSSMLHIGTVEPKSLPDTFVTANFAVMYLLSLFIFVVVGLTVYASCVLLQMATPNLRTMVLISLLGGFLSTTFLNLASYYIAISSFRFGLDPDNDTIPLITSLTDVVGVLCLLGAIHILL